MIFEYIFVLGGDIATWCQILGGNVTGEFTKGGNVNADSKNWEVIWRLMGENKKADYGRKYEYAPFQSLTRRKLSDWNLSLLFGIFSVMQFLLLPLNATFDMTLLHRASYYAW